MKGPVFEPQVSAEEVVVESGQHEQHHNGCKWRRSRKRRRGMKAPFTNRTMTTTSFIKARSGSVIRQIAARSGEVEHMPGDALLQSHRSLGGFWRHGR